MGLPTWLCSLDLETTNTKFRQPERSELLFVGTREYKGSGNGFRGGRHRVWSRDDLSELESYLRSFDGLVIGHNILRFDYGVLRPHIDLNGVIEKTVDTLALCWWKRWHISFDPQPDMPRYLSWHVGPEVRGLSLDNLARLNLRAAKSMDPKEFQAAWRNDRAAAYEYNAQDCSLTKRLWLRLVLGKPVRVTADEKIELSEKECATGCGKGPWVSFDDWDLWRRIEFIPAERGDPEWIPLKRCPRCGEWRDWTRYDEASSDSDWTDGQMAEWLAGNWGTAYCGNCGLAMDWEDGQISFTVDGRSFGEVVTGFSGGQNGGGDGGA